MKATDGMNTTGPHHLTGAEFERTVLGAALPVVVDFWAEWCVPCRMIAPAVHKLAAEFAGRALVAKLNADEAPEIVARYGILSIPTLIYFKNGREMDRVVGYSDYRPLKNKLERLLV
jgi:thioredoxin 1